MFSLKIRYTLYGVIISASFITIVAQASTVDGVFGEYFRNMVGVCSTTDAKVITGFDSNPSLFGDKVCTKLTSLLDTIGINVVGTKVGLGEIAPSAKLEIAGPVDNMIRLNKQGSTKWNYIEWSILGARQYWTGLDVNGIFNIQSDNNTDPVLINANGGDVGIGTSTPTARLEVAGNIIADTPTANNHVATKGYVDSMGGSLRTLPILSGATVGLKPVSSGEFIFSNSNMPVNVTDIQSVNDIIFVGGGGAMRFSTDNGVTWGNISGGNYSHVAYGAGRYVFTPRPGHDNGGYVNSLTLPNTTPSNTTLPFSATTYNGIAYGAEKFVVAAGGHTPINSTDGITWNDPGTGPTIGGTSNITWMPSASLFIIQSYGSDYHTSPDGITWTLRHAPVLFTGTYGIYINGAYYAKEYDTAQWYKTTDGISWVLAGVGPIRDDTNSGLTYYNGVYIIFSIYKIYTSTDFNKWIARDSIKYDRGYNGGNIVSTSQGVFLNLTYGTFYLNGIVMSASDTVDGVFY